MHADVILRHELLHIASGSLYVARNHARGYRVAQAWIRARTRLGRAAITVPGMRDEEFPALGAVIALGPLVERSNPLEVLRSEDVAPLYWAGLSKADVRLLRGWPGSAAELETYLTATQHLVARLALRELVALLRDGRLASGSVALSYVVPQTLADAALANAMIGTST